MNDYEDTCWGWGPESPALGPGQVRLQPHRVWVGPGVGKRAGPRQGGRPWQRAVSDAIRDSGTSWSPLIRGSAHCFGLILHARGRSRKLQSWVLLAPKPGARKPRVSLSQQRQPQQALALHRARTTSLAMQSFGAWPHTSPSSSFHSSVHYAPPFY